MSVVNERVLFTESSSQAPPHLFNCIMYTCDRKAGVLDRYTMVLHACIHLDIQCFLCPVCYMNNTHCICSIRCHSQVLAIANIRVACAHINKPRDSNGNIKHAESIYDRHISYKNAKYNRLAVLQLVLQLIFVLFNICEGV